jgi:NADPH:quinone reductase-like Zn-dependent oxidoreductase
MPWEEAAAIPEAFLTAYDALFPQLGISAGERVLIHAVASGVGTAAVQLARRAGAVTLGTSRTESKLHEVSSLGLEHAILADGRDWAAAILAATDGQGINAILDLVGGNYHESNLRLLAERGRLIIVGLLAGARVELDLGLVLRKRLHLMGTIMRTRSREERIALASLFAANVLPDFAAGSLRPVIDSILPFADIAAAHRRMEANLPLGKIVLVW